MVREVRSFLSLETCACTEVTAEGHFFLMLSLVTSYQPPSGFATVVLVVTDCFAHTQTTEVCFKRREQMSEQTHEPKQTGNKV